MSENNVDYLIVGQGLAGSILAYQLIMQGKNVMVIDNDHKQSSSSVAAGIINPITGRRLSLADDFPTQFLIAKEFYQQLETELNVHLWTDVKQQRQISQQQQSSYKKRQTDKTYRNYLNKETQSLFFDDSSIVVNIQDSAIVDCKTLIKTIRVWLKEKQSLLCEKIDYAKIVIKDKSLSLARVNAKKLIFCEGYQAINNPWLKGLPFVLSKGEILTVETNQTVNTLLNWGNWLAPIAGKTKLGSNYEWDNLSLDQNNQVKQDLLNSLYENTKLQAKVVAHETGIRPTTRHRKPFIGRLSELENAYCFNGFGSKGCLLIPYYADLFSNTLLNHTELPKELTQWL